MSSRNGKAHGKRNLRQVPAEEWRLINAPDMNIEFVQEIAEEDRQLRMGLTGWEMIVFELEDDQIMEPSLQPVGAG